MDAANDIAEFLTTRRARVTPEQAGLPSYGRRRVQGLRREEVASLAGVRVEYYKRLERGNVSGASELVLEGLARALQLDHQVLAFLCLREWNAAGQQTRRARTARTINVFAKSAAQPGIFAAADFLNAYEFAMQNILRFGAKNVREATGHA